MRKLKRALCLSGGGSKGSWQSGAIRELAKHYPEGFDLISGTSVGALNGAFLAHWNMSDFSLAADNLVEIWEENLKIWEWRWPHYVAGLWNHSFATCKGLRQLMNKHFDTDRVRKSDVGLSITTVDIQNGEIHRWTDQDDRIKNATLASASFPVYFPLVEINGRHHTDGGVRDIAPLKPALDIEPDEIVVITTSSLDWNDTREVPTNAVENLSAVLDIMTTEILKNDVKNCHPSLKIKIIAPYKPLGDALSFDRKMMREQIKRGVLDTRRALGGVV